MPTSHAMIAVKMINCPMFYDFGQLDTYEENTEISHFFNFPKETPTKIGAVQPKVKITRVPQEEPQA